MHSSSARKHYISTWASESDLPQRVKVTKSNSQLQNSLNFNKFWGDVAARTGIVRVTWTAYLWSVWNYCFLLTELSCNVTLKCIIFYKLIIKVISTNCIHYTNQVSCLFYKPVISSSLLMEYSQFTFQMSSIYLAQYPYEGTVWWGDGASSNLILDHSSQLNGTRKIILRTQHSLLFKFFLFLCPTSFLYCEIYIYIYIRRLRDCLLWHCFQITQRVEHCYENH